LGLFVADRTPNLIYLRRGGAVAKVSAILNLATLWFTNMDEQDGQDATTECKRRPKTF
jgi:hypothetical protein